MKRYRAWHFVLATVVTLALAGAGTAKGDLITLDQTFGPASIPDSPASATFTFNFAQFDQSLGTLTGVQIDVTSHLTAEIDVFNFGGTPKPFSNATATTTATVSGPDASSNTSPISAGPISGTANPGLNTFPGNTTSNLLSVIVPPANFGFYQGLPSGSQVTVNVSDSPITVSGTGGVAFLGSGFVDGDVKLTYIYTPFAAVPEPSSFALLTGLGLLGGVGYRLRRRKHASA